VSAYWCSRASFLYASRAVARSASWRARSSVSARPLVGARAYGVKPERCERVGDLGAKRHRAARSQRSEGKSRSPLWEELQPWRDAVAVRRRFLDHLFIFDQWMAAVPPHLRPHIHGTASFGAPYRARSGAELSFPSGNTSRADFKLVVTCDIGTAVAPNRLLSGIECIRMYYHSDMFEEEESRNVFDSPPVQNLPNVVALGLIQYNAKTAEEQIFLRSWLSARQGRMQHVSFMGCHPCIHWLSHALEDEGLVPSTAWSDEIL
jgi:hypothetical protein